jgi:GT2 family glycosyltransferase
LFLPYQAGLFERLGGFDPVFYMYADEYDLSWRLWVAGAKAISVPAARLHHRGAGRRQPGGRWENNRKPTSETKRFYTNRNGLLLLLKNCQNLLLLMVPLQVFLLVAEGTVGMILVRRWSFFRRATLVPCSPVGSCAPTLGLKRKRLAALRQRSDWWMLRFFPLAF